MRRSPRALVALAAVSIVVPVVGIPPAAGAVEATAVADDCVVGRFGAADPAGDPLEVYSLSRSAQAGILPAAAAVSPDGARVVSFSRDRKVITISASDGSGARTLVDLSATVYQLLQWGDTMWAGDHLAFLVADTSAGYDRWNRLATVNVATGKFTVVDPAMPVEPNGFDLSRDGTKVVYADASGVYRGSHIWTATSNGTSRVKIVNDPQPDHALPPYFPPKSVTGLRWSPDGTQIAFSGRDGVSVTGQRVGASYELWVMSSTGAGLTDIAPATPGGGDPSRLAPMWSPDGKRIAYSRSYLDGTHRADLAIVTVATRASTKIPGTDNTSVIWQKHGRWSATSNTIVFDGIRGDRGGTADYDYGIMAIKPTGGTLQLLRATSGEQGHQLAALIPCSSLPPSSFAGLTPARILDTRTGVGAPAQPIGHDAAIDVQVLGRGGVPAAGVGAVALNVTATNTTADSYLTVSPTGVQRPNASNVNWNAGKTVPNAVVVKIGDGGRINLYNAFGTTDVLVDVVGWFKSGPGFQAITPTRLLDTRTGVGAPAGAVGDGGDIRLAVHGAAVPASASGVVLNTTAADPSATGYVTVYPSGTARRETSSLNLTAGRTIANLVVSQIGADGGVRFYNAAGSTHLIADAAGYFEAGSGFTGIAPLRVLDTRSSGQLRQDRSIDVQVRGGELGIPTSARAVVVNVTAVDPTDSSYLTVYPYGVTRPDASNLNVEAGQNVPNLVFAQVGDDHRISIYNAFGSLHVLVDIVGYFV